MYKVVIANSAPGLLAKLTELSITAGDIISLYHDSSNGLHVAWVHSVPKLTTPVVSHRTIPDGQTAGTLVKITIQVHTPLIESIKLFYRTTGAPAYIEGNMEYVTGTQGVYKSFIPSSVVAAPSVDYYIEVSDGTGTTSVGTAGAPNTFTIV